MILNIPIWRIKYLPNSLDEFCGREKLKAKLRSILDQGNFPHMLFVGTEGIGKTTLARLFAKEFLGPNYEINFRLVYADVPLNSEERKRARSEAYIPTSKIGSLAGKTVRTPAFLQIKIKPFVQLRALGSVPFKLLAVKNFESLGSDQQGFRRLMESYGSNCRMILITQNISGIIDPIISRCQIFMIAPPKYESFKELIKKISNKESLVLEEQVIKNLYRITKGKLAQAIDILQLCSLSNATIDNENLYETTMNFTNDLIHSLLLMCLRGDFLKARELSRKIQSIYKYRVPELFLLLFRDLGKIPLSDFTFSSIMNIIADADFRAIDGRDSDIQISNLISKLCYFSEFL
jgi:replication factor C small subunit